MYTTLQWQLVLVATGFVWHRLTLQPATGDGVFLRNWQLRSGPNWLQSSPVAGFSIWLQPDFKTLISIDKNVQILQPVTEVHTGLQGRPKKIVDIEFLKEAVSNSRHIPCTELARVLGVHRNTLCLYMKNHGIERKYTCISNADLDKLIAKFKTRQPNSSIRYIVGFLWKSGIRVQYCHIIQSVHRIDRLGQMLRERRVMTRHEYYVERPNALWHMDGHHKLIRWGIVIHGFIDDFFRTVCFLTNEV